MSGAKLLSRQALEALSVTLQVALSASLIIAIPGILAGLLLARKEFAGKGLVETIVSLPLVMPPSAVGYVLLSFLSVDGILGSRTLGIDLDLLFTWKGAVLASSVMSFPLVARTARVAFESVDPLYESMARTLGYSRFTAFFRITVPLAGKGLAAAMIMGFSRALGEFGATVIVAGNIPGKTQTLALAIFSDIQAGRSDDARILLILTTFLGFAGIYATQQLTRGISPSGRGRS